MDMGLRGLRHKQYGNGVLYRALHKLRKLRRVERHNDSDCADVRPMLRRQHANGSNGNGAMVLDLYDRRLDCSLQGIDIRELRSDRLGYSLVGPNDRALYGGQHGDGRNGNGAVVLVLQVGIDLQALLCIQRRCASMRKCGLLGAKLAHGADDQAVLDRSAKPGQHFRQLLGLELHRGNPDGEL